MKYLITGGMGVNGAVTARLMVRDGLRPLLMDNRVDYTLIEDIKNQVDIVTRRRLRPGGTGKSRR